MTRPDYEKILKPYKEHLRWSDLEKVTGDSRRTLERKRAARKLRLPFVDLYGDGVLRVPKAAVIQWLNERWRGTQEKLTPPSLADVRGA